MDNIPKHNSNHLYIYIRSGDIFMDNINIVYSQPFLCFHQKIINENNFSDIYIISNRRENPVVDKLIQLYPKKKFIHGSLENDTSIIVYAYNLVIATSTFSGTLIKFNNNLKIFIFMNF